MNFQPIVVAAVEHAKAQNSLLWADLLAERIAASTPLRFDRDAIAERLTLEAIRQGVPVTMARSTKSARH